MDEMEDVDIPQTLRDKYLKNGKLVSHVKESNLKEIKTTLLEVFDVDGTLEFYA